MKKLTLKLIVTILAMALVLVPLVSCGSDTNNDAPSTTTTSNDNNETPSVDKDLEMKIYLLNGTTALGASKLIVDAKNESTDMNYKIETFAAADSITGAIVTGECAIAALPTNAAANLYKKSAGKIQLLAVNTLVVLYLLNNGEEISDFESLKGKTVYLPGAGSNPEFITAALFEANGLSKDDVTPDTATYPSPDALSAAVISGDAKLAVLPQPKVTTVMMKNESVEIAMDFTAEWEEIYGKDTMAQGCLVVNTQFAKDHPAELS
jgi:NitT/TauT family transport system substrate-binding protein